nr:unnamed protein product [Digitaria exilis]
MEAALVSVSTGVMKSVLSKLTKLLEAEYVKLKGMRKQIKFLRDELSAMAAALQILADSEQLNPLIREWRDKVRELAYDIEDCIDAFTAHFDHDRTTSFRGFFRKLKKLKARREIANEIEELKARAIEASERHKRYNFMELVSNSRSFHIDPRLPALYEEVDRLVGIDRPRKHVIEWLNKEKGNQNLKVLSIVGTGGLGKTTLAIQAYSQLKDQFQYTNFVSVSRNPCIKRILRLVLNEVGISNEILCDEQQLIDKIRDFLKDKR